MRRELLPIGFLIAVGLLSVSSVATSQTLWGAQMGGHATVAMIVAD